MDIFAKLLEVNGYQILVQKDTNEKDEPTLVITFQPNGMGLCSFTPTFNDNDDGYEARDKAFDEVTEEKVYDAIKADIEKMEGLFNGK